MVYDFIKHKLVPPVFLMTFTASVQVLAVYAKGDSVTWDSTAEGLLGDARSWLAVTSFILWAYVWLIVPGPIIKGPVSPVGYVPVYKNNGLLYYFVTTMTYIIADALVNHKLSHYIYNEMPNILGTLNILALILCIYLFLGPSDQPELDKNLPAAFIFYRGRKYNPRLLGFDVKQMTNCRIGLMSFQILITAFYVESLLRRGFTPPEFTLFLLQTVYIAKFFHWESGYFSTIDIELDRAGFYLCWGCIVWIPCFLCFNSYYLVHHTPVLSNLCAWMTLLLGVWAICVEYKVDDQRTQFRTSDGKCKVWGKPPSYITASYVDHKGEKKKSLLLTSGYWGLARHLNYALELVYSICVCIPGHGLGFTPYAFFVFVLGTVVHRLFRDDEKCRKKYGKHWQEYCEAVPYKMIPYLY